MASKPPTAETPLLDPDWITVGEACRLRRPSRGRRTHPSTIHRWIECGQLECLERPRAGTSGRRETFVRRSQVLALMVPRPPERSPLATATETTVNDRWTEEVLRRAKLKT